MQDRLAEPLTLADIAAEVHLSVYHFVRVFRNATGETSDRPAVRLRRTRPPVDGVPAPRRCPAVGPQDLIVMQAI
ncbi:helix-turn-helix transcriptional regulator [Streptomyces sp. NPDC004393]